MECQLIIPDDSQSITDCIDRDCLVEEVVESHKAWLHTTAGYTQL